MFFLDFCFTCLVLSINSMIILANATNKTGNSIYKGSTVINGSKKLTTDAVLTYVSNKSLESNSPFNNKGSPAQFHFGDVAFSALRAHTRSKPGDYDIQHVQFDQSITNVGQGWNPRDSYFKCIVPGIYVFSWTAVSPPKSETKVGLFINGKETGHQLWAAENGKQSASQTAIVSLNRGALVELRLTEGRLYEPANSRRPFNAFSGFRLF